jgi:RNA polymerase sigma-70 factor (ECF subfamily)
MDETRINQRINQISTIWSIVKRAHGPEVDERQAALTVLIKRYEKAIYRYVLQALNNDPHAADEVCQEFALRLVRGDFRAADPSRGRFRDLVRTALINLVINHQKKTARQPTFDPALVDALSDGPAVNSLQENVLNCWRRELLDRAWEALAAEQAGDGLPFFPVLRLRIERPDLTAADLAEMLTVQFRPAIPYTEPGFRKALQRARERFGALLLNEVEQSLHQPCCADLEDALHELGFLLYCRKALETHSNKHA